MNLHHHAVLDAHARHLGEHLRPKQFGIVSGSLAGDCPLEQRFGFALRQIGSQRSGMAVVGRSRAVRAKLRAAQS